MERFDELEKKRLIAKEIGTQLEKAEARFTPAIEKASEFEKGALQTEAASQNLADSLESRVQNEKSIERFSNQKDDLNAWL